MADIIERVISDNSCISKAKKGKEFVDYVPAPQFVTETLNVSANGTYNSVYSV